MSGGAKSVVLPTATIGADGRRVTRLGLGGEGPILRSFGRRREAIALIRRALELGITYFDTARAYDDSEAYLGAALGGERDGVFVASKTASRRAAAAAVDLDTTLRNLRTDHLDLWQVHDLRRREEWLEASSPGGALEALEHARAVGKVRFLGVTAHRNPELLAEVLQDYRFDAVLMPVNVLEARLPGFATTVTEIASACDVSVVGMLVMAQGVLPEAGIPPELLIRFALGRPAAVLAVGAETPEQIEENVRSVAKGPLEPEDERRLRDLVAPFADRLAFYRGEPAREAVAEGAG